MLTRLLETPTPAFEGHGREPPRIVTDLRQTGAAEQPRHGHGREPRRIVTDL